MNIKHLNREWKSFVSENGLKITTAGLLVDGPNAVQPKFRIVVDEKKRESVVIYVEEK